MTIDRDRLLGQAETLVRGMLEKVEQAREIEFASLPQGRTALIMVDMIIGFAKKGALSSPRVDLLVPGVVRVLQQAKRLGIPAIAFADAHPEDSVEFLAYPPHCIAGTEESEVVPELQEIGGYTLIPKNSTNGFLEPAFKEWLSAHSQIDTFVVAGDCTDICVIQFALTLKTEFDRQNRPVRIIVPADAVDTFDAPNHDGDFLHVVALNLMMGNGIEVVSTLR